MIHNALGSERVCYITFYSYTDSKSRKFASRGLNVLKIFVFSSQPIMILTIFVIMFAIFIILSTFLKRKEFKIILCKNGVNIS